MWFSVKVWNKEGSLCVIIWSCIWVRCVFVEKRCSLGCLWAVGCPCLVFWEAIDKEASSNRPERNTLKNDFNLDWALTFLLIILAGGCWYQVECNRKPNSWTDWRWIQATLLGNTYLTKNHRIFIPCWTLIQGNGFLPNLCIRICLWSWESILFWAFWNSGKQWVRAGRGWVGQGSVQRRF